MTTVSWILIAVVLILLATGFVVMRGTRAKTRWGLAVGPKSCPTCGTPPPVLGIPNSLNQALWGGTTCRACGTEADKWGRRIETKG